MFRRSNPYLILALDHRSSLRKLLNSQNPKAVTPAEITHWKKTALKALLPLVTHVLVDPDYGLPVIESIGKDDKKLILSIEKSGYQEVSGERVSALEYSVEELKNLGTDIIKLLIYFNPRAQSAGQQKALIKKVSLSCEKYNLPFLLEIVPYALPQEEGNPQSREIILESAQAIMDLNCKIDIYKTCYPGDKICRQLTDILDIPWVLLSGGENFVAYKKHLTIAMQNGASGFAAGRALWQDFTKWPKENWSAFFENVVKKKLEEIIKIVRIIQPATSP